MRILTTVEKTGTVIVNMKTGLKATIVGTIAPWQTMQGAGFRVLTETGEDLCLPFKNLELFEVLDDSEETRTRTFHQAHEAANQKIERIYARLGGD